MEETVICQSKNYLFNSLLQEFSIPYHTGYEMDADVMFWTGYLLMYWQFMEGLSGEELIHKYDLKSIMENYDVLHTMSVKAAIKTIKQDYSRTAE